MVVIEKNIATNKLVDAWEALQIKTSGERYVQAICKNAIGSFSRLGIPNKKNEEYKYSQVEKIFKAQFRVQNSEFRIDKKTVEKLAIPGLDAYYVVLVNGIFNPEFSSKISNDIVVKSLIKAFTENKEIVQKYFSSIADIDSDAFIALNTAFTENGLFIHIPKKTKVEKPIHLINIYTSEEDVLLQPRNLFVVEERAEVKIIETFKSLSAHKKIIVNTLTEAAVGKEAHVQYYRLQNDTAKTFYINTFHAQQQEKSVLDTNTIILNTEWLRNNLHIILNAQHAETHLNGLFFTELSQHVDNHTLVDHQQPNCNSNQLYKGILNDRSTGIFNGKIFVRKDAQKTNAYQSSKNILLSDDATINSKPQLEIYADDVKCSHGSSTGHLDESALFYLRSRGISTENARKLLLQAFANDVVNTIKIEPLREYVTSIIEEKLQGG